MGLVISKPDYSSYSVKELYDVYHNIDRERFPERFKIVCDELKRHGVLDEEEVIVQDKEVEILLNGDEQEDCYTTKVPEPQYDDDGNYIPNEVPLKNRVTNAAYSAGIIIYGGHGIYTNDFYLPTKTGNGLHLTDGAAIVMFLAIICAAAMMITEIVDHYDKRDNERKYFEFAHMAKYSAYTCFFTAIVIAFIYR